MVLLLLSCLCRCRGMAMPPVEVMVVEVLCGEEEEEVLGGGGGEDMERSCLPYSAAMDFTLLSPPWGGGVPHNFSDFISTSTALAELTLKSIPPTFDARFFSLLSSSSRSE